MRKRFISQPKGIVDARKQVRVISKDLSLEKCLSRPGTACMQPNSFSNWLSKLNTTQNTSSPKIYSPFNRDVSQRPSIIEMLIAKHKTSAAKIKSEEFLKKTMSTRPVALISPRLQTSATIKTPELVRVVEAKVVRETPKLTSYLTKTRSFETLDSFVLGNEIGKGAYATVRLAQNKDSNLKVAIKVYEKYKLLTPSRKKNAEREIKILTKLSHPNIVKLYSTVENNKSLNLIMEFVSGCSLMALVKKRYNKKLDEAEARMIFRQLLSALDYCHNLSITHRDIKLENILIDSNHSVKLIDFGFSTCFSNTKKLKLFCGTPSYMSPEIVSKQESFGPPSDIWAAGVVLYVLLSGAFPFRAPHSKELYAKIQKGGFVMPGGISVEAASLISSMLQVDPLKRPSAGVALDHPWFKDRSLLKTHSVSSSYKDIPQVRVSLNNTFDQGKDLYNDMYCS